MGGGDFDIGKSTLFLSAAQTDAALRRAAGQLRQQGFKNAANDLTRAANQVAFETFNGGRVDQFGNPVPVSLTLAPATPTVPGTSTSAAGGSPVTTPVSGSAAAPSSNAFWLIVIVLVILFLLS